MTPELPIEISIRPLEKTDPIPYDLLLDADPSKILVDQYLKVSEVFIALYNDTAIGVYVMSRLNSDRMEIKNIAVKESYQSKGIGKIMLNDALQRAKLGGYGEVIIGTSSTSIRPLYLYQKVGFEVSEIKRNFFIDNYAEALFDNGIQCKHMIVLKKIL